MTKDSLDDEGEGGELAALERRLQQDQDDDEADRREMEGEGGEDTSKKGINEDDVFMRSYIPRTLNEVYDPERDVGVLNRGEGEGLIYKDTIGIVAPKENKVRFEDDGKDEEDGSTSGEEDEEEDGSGEEEDEDGEKHERKSRGHRNEDKEAKKVRVCLALH